MHTAADRNQFAPPPPPGMLRAFVLAIFAHVLLLLALTWGVNWKRDAENVAAEAELWAATPQQAAPRLAEPPPLRAPPPPVLKAEPPPKSEALPTPRAPDIALEREKKKKQAETKQRQDDAEQKKKLEAQKKVLDQKKQDEAKKKDDQKKQERTKKADDDQKKADTARTEQAREQADSKRAEAQRQDNLRRMQGLAGATGGPAAGGTAQRSAGMSDSYGGRIQARVRPNIVFSDDVSGNPTALVEVRMAPDGTITGKRIVKSSGVKAWDEAVLRALDKTEVLPRDVDGRVHTPLEIQFSPK